MLSLVVRFIATMVLTPAEKPTLKNVTMEEAQAGAEVAIGKDAVCEELIK